MKSFENIARLVKEARLAHPSRMSQSDLSHKLGYKNGQFISNVERALCSIPLKSLGLFCEVLEVPKEKVVQVILKDTEATIDQHFKRSKLGKPDGDKPEKGLMSQICA